MEKLLVKNPNVILNNGLAKYDAEILNPKKLQEANKTIAKYGVPRTWEEKNTSTNGGMKPKFFFLLTLSILLIFCNCASVKQKDWLVSYQTELTRVANDSLMKPEAKMDVVMTTYANVMEQGMKFLDPRKGAKYIQTFQEQNQENITKITESSSDWVSGLNTTEGITLGLRVTQKDYFARYVDLLPKLYRKYEQYKAVYSLTKTILGGFGNYGDTVLGMFLK